MTDVTHDPADQPAGPRLNGWKEIATHLGRGVRTAQRWEREFGLPVRRIGQDRSESVFAFTTEIDGWLASSSAASAKGHVTPDGAPAADAGEVSAAHDEARLEVPSGAAGESGARQWPGVRGRQTVVTVRRGRFALLVAASGLSAALIGLALWFALAGWPVFPFGGHGPGVVCTYHLDEGAGAVLLDSEPTPLHGTVKDGAWADGRVGKALDFGPGFRSGTHMVAVFPGAFPFHAPGTDASLSFWVKLVDGTHRTLFWTRGDAHSPDADRFHIYSGGAQKLTGPAIGIDYASPEGANHFLFEIPVSVGRWIHVVLVRTGTRHYTLYLDGEPVGSRDDVQTRLPTYSSDWALWRMQDNPYPKQNGMLDEITLWNRALSASEVKALGR